MVAISQEEVSDLSSQASANTETDQRISSSILEKKKTISRRSSRDALQGEWQTLDLARRVDRMQSLF